MVCQYKDEYLIKTKIILFFNKAEFGENCFHFPCRITLCSLLFLICSFYLLTLRIHIMCSLINLVILFFNVFNKKTFWNKRATTIESKLKTHFTSSSNVNDFDFPKPLRETFLYSRVCFFFRCWEIVKCSCSS